MKKHLDLQERKVLQDLLDHGTKIEDIANILHRSGTAIRAEIKRNGGIRHYDAEKAEEMSITRQKERNVAINSPVQHLRRRVDQLEKEMQQLKGLLKHD